MRPAMLVLGIAAILALHHYRDVDGFAASHGAASLDYSAAEEMRGDRQGRVASRSLAQNMALYHQGARSWAEANAGHSGPIDGSAVLAELPDRYRPTGPWRAYMDAAHGLVVTWADIGDASAISGLDASRLAEDLVRSVGWTVSAGQIVGPGWRSIGQDITVPVPVLPGISLPEGAPIRVSYLRDQS